MNVSMDNETDGGGGGGGLERARGPTVGEGETTEVECFEARLLSTIPDKPLLLEVYATPPHESRDPNQPIANFRCISVAPEEARFSGLPLLKSLLVIILRVLYFSRKLPSFQAASQPELQGPGLISMTVRSCSPLRPETPVTT
ncbi:hypothetical protein WN51_08580 [Melipona quadrifasciata]|uniref:Uncharacterized protein n=1 Tax=Melipona quadrifasciata TaxID=166423 RepID=A0A0N1ITZ6_9HYME|nr:hypothetical protein WN51_08580 [Melipona quadrifasciata]